MSEHPRLEISSKLSLPIDVVTQKLAFMGRSGSGKTYAAMKLAELLFEAGVQIVAIDPVGVWYGLRIGADGKKAGLPIRVFGGLHGDVPLEETGGALIADLIIDRAISAVIDTSQFESQAAQCRFVAAFAERFFFRKKAEPSAVHLFVEECQEFVPERPQGTHENNVLHQMRRLIKIGRNYGVGDSLISQRPQAVSKEVLNMTEVMFALQMTGPHERDAIKRWIADKGGEDVVELLPKLEVGQALVCSPQWLKISETIRIAKKKTFDASSTPTFGAGARVEPKPLNDSDLAELRDAMVATIEKARENDPRELKAQVRALQDELEELKHCAILDPTDLPMNAIEQAQMDELVAFRERTQERSQRIAENLRQANELLEDVYAIAAALADDTAQNGGEALPSIEERRQSTAPPPPPRAQVAHASVRAPRDTPDGLSRMHRAFLTALAQHPDGLNRGTLHVVSDYRASGDTSKCVAQMIRDGWVLDDKQKLRITSAGLMVLGSFERLPVGRELLRRLIGSDSKLAAFERKALEVVSKSSGAMKRGAIVEGAGYKQSGDTSKGLAKLKRLGYVVETEGGLALSSRLRG